MIAMKDWERYIARLKKISDKAAAEMQAYVDRFGFGNTTAIINHAYALATKYGEAAAAAACDMYDAVAAVSRVSVPAAAPAETATFGDVAKAINGAINQGAEGQVPQITGRYVKRAGADTTLKNAIRDGAEFAWVPHGDTCAFCITLASGGWRRASEKALKGGHAEHIHSNCDCEYAIRFGDDDGVRGYDPDRYKRIYYDHGGDINSIRREQYQKNKEKINAQKRERYHVPQNEMLRLARQGNTYVTKTERLASYAKKIKPYKDYTDIVGHGDPYSMIWKDADGHESIVTAKEFADILEKGGIYKGGKIRLIACQTGAGSGIVPTYLAKRFNTEVLAPTEIVNVDFDGKMILANSKIDAKMGIETGEWIRFGPNGRIK